MKKLLIIESPNKIKTLNKYLDSDFNILATIGHIRDLSKYSYGFDMETLEPKWTIPKSKKFANETPKEEIIKQIKKQSAMSDEIYLATDPDREGEAIAWHVYDILDEKDKKKCKRITFNEITKSAILESFDHKRDIDLNWVHSQFSRRILDRLIGYKLSKLMQIKLKAESAGRVQSVVLKFIDEREKEIEKFVSEYWWTIDVGLETGDSLFLKEVSNELTNVKLSETQHSSVINFADIDSANIVLNSLGEEYEVIDISEPSYTTQSPRAPYKTSTLQQDAINKLNWSSKKTTMIAQRLYEGVDVDGSQIALISYPRTDSVRLSDSFIQSCKSYIETEFGKDYVGPNIFKKTEQKKEQNVQNAHEAIRPINTSITPKSLENKISKDELSLYRLIWNRTISSLMASAKFKKISIKFNNNKNIFSTFSKEMIFDGFKKVYIDDSYEKENVVDLSKYKIGFKFKSKTVDINEHKTNPPGKFNQASLIAELENAGVGRPSTYSTMVNVVIDRGYASIENKSFIMTDMGKEVIVQLDKFFPTIINKNFTKEMEEHLDKIANGNEDWRKWIKEFMPVFDQELKIAHEAMEKKEDEKVGRNCPLCNNDLVYKHSRGNSKFIGCKSYPNCKYIESLNKNEVLPQKCPECSHDLLMRTSRKGSKFVGCSNWPKCTYILSDKKYFSLIKENPDSLPNKSELEALKINKSKKSKNK